MTTFKTKIRYSVTFETEIELDGETAIGAMDLAKARIAKNDIPAFSEARRTQPYVVSVEQVK